MALLHVTPVVAVWVNGALCFTTGAEEQKFANVRRNPHVVLTTGCSRRDRGVDVIAEGYAVQVTDDVVLRKLAAACTARLDAGGSSQSATALWESR